MPNDEMKSGKSGDSADSEDALQQELEQESAEGKDSVGDVRLNKNLSGASTWDTLPDEQADADSSDSGKKSD
jgi:hypothetical protein